MATNIEELVKLQTLRMRLLLADLHNGEESSGLIRCLERVEDSIFGMLPGIIADLRELERVKAFNPTLAKASSDYAAASIGEEFPADATDESNYVLTPGELLSVIERGIEDYVERAALAGKVTP